ncbi:MAG: DUF1638 domain-containing protein [Thalassovita sp.]
MHSPDDHRLTTQGLPPASKSGRVLIIACGALAHEILALIRLNGWTHMDLTCLPAILHNHPERIADAVAHAIAKHQHSHEQLFVAYADCGTGGALQQVCDRHKVQMIAGPHCYAFFEGVDHFASHADEITAFYLTDFLTRQFDAFVWKPLGLDRHPDLRQVYFGHYTKLVYQAQTDNPELTAKAQDCATRLGLKFERRFTGYGDLATTLAQQT